MADEYQAVRRFTVNTVGRDFVVGDIHGEFGKLQRALDAYRFDPSCDRLFSVGDLIDRGRDSPAAARWLTLPWFHAVLGNHEDMALHSDDSDTLYWWTRVNGGEWWLALDDAERMCMLEAFRRLPLAIEVETAAGLVGIVHADVPRAMTWKRFAKLLAKGDRRVRETALWGRSRAREGDAGPVSGIDRVFCGHTPMTAARTVDNVCLIDTGACYGRELTLLTLDGPLPPDLGGTALT